MADFTQNAATKIVKATKIVLNTPIDQRGRPSHKRGGTAALPKGQYQGMLYQNVVQNRTGFDFLIANTLI